MYGITFLFLFIVSIKTGNKNNRSNNEKLLIKLLNFMKVKNLEIWTFVL